jgi:hypothetical protein
MTLVARDETPFYSVKELSFLRGTCRCRQTISELDAVRLDAVRNFSMGRAARKIAYKLTFIYYVLYIYICIYTNFLISIYGIVPYLSILILFQNSKGPDA